MRKYATLGPKFPLWSLPACLLALLVFWTAPAEAQSQPFRLDCNGDRAFHPSTSNGQPQFHDVDVLLPITSSAPDIATGKRVRVGGGTDGGIEIAAHGKEGDATITYKVKDGAVTTVTVQVHVECPPNRTPTHRQTNCQACKADAARLNAAIDKLSQAQAQGNQTRIKQLEKEVRKLTEKLDDCEKKHCPGKENQPPGKGGGL